MIYFELTKCHHLCCCCCNSNELWVFLKTRNHSYTKVLEHCSLLEKCVQLYDFYIYLWNKNISLSWRSLFVIKNMYHKISLYTEPIIHVNCWHVWCLLTRWWIIHWTIWNIVYELFIVTTSLIKTWMDIFWVLSNGISSFCDFCIISFVPEFLRALFVTNYTEI